LRAQASIRNWNKAEDKTARKRGVALEERWIRWLEGEVEKERARMGVLGGLEVSGGRAGWWERVGRGGKGERRG